MDSVTVPAVGVERGPGRTGSGQAHQDFVGDDLELRCGPGRPGRRNPGTRRLPDPDEGLAPGVQFAVCLQIQAPVEPDGRSKQRPL